MNVSEAISKLIGIPESKIPSLLKDGPDDHKLCLDGTILGLKMPVPACNGALLRVGRHLWKVTWMEENGNIIERKAEQLTQAGT